MSSYPGDDEALSGTYIPYDDDMDYQSADPVDGHVDTSTTKSHSRSLNKHHPTDTATLPTLDDIRRSLSAGTESGSARITEMFRSMKDKVLDQVDALPDAVRGAIAQWDQYRVEHPHVVVAGAILTVIGAVILLYGPNALALDFLRMLGFSELGPIAGQFPYLSFDHLLLVFLFHALYVQVRGPRASNLTSTVLPLAGSSPSSSLSP